jgi:enoyl-CoA hydratase/carnithine racemase
VSSVLVDVREQVAVISLNRPHKRNAIDDELYGSLADAVATAVADDEVRVLLLRGEGPSFSSGRDTSALGNRDPGDTHFAHLRRSQRLNLMLSDAPKPVIAALKGHVLGMGLETALAADIRVIATGARLGLPETALGLITDSGGAARLTALVGPARAKYLLLTAQPIEAEQALAWGLGEVLVEPDALDDVSFALARQIAGNAPLAVGVAKDLVDQVHRGAVANSTRSEALAQIALFSTADYQEARQARRDGRDPSFSGR